MATKKGIITLTLVISRAPTKPTVIRGLYVMWNIFKVRTKLKYQIDEYIIWKSSKSTYVANDQREILKQFIKPLKCISVSEIQPSDIDDFYKKILGLQTTFSRIKSMRAIRGFMAYFYMKKQHNINPKQITDYGIYKPSLQNVAKNDILEPVMRKKVGRPRDIAFSKKVKTLRDKGGLSFRAIARAENTNPGNIHRAYHYDLTT